LEITEEEKNSPPFDLEEFMKKNLKKEEIKALIGK
jgi:predicted nucleotidyltransferase